MRFALWILKRFYFHDDILADTRQLAFVTFLCPWHELLHSLLYVNVCVIWWLHSISLSNSSTIPEVNNRRFSKICDKLPFRAEERITGGGQLVPNKQVFHHYLVTTDGDQNWADAGANGMQQQSYVMLGNLTTLCTCCVCSNFQLLRNCTCKQANNHLRFGGYFIFTFNLAEISLFC